MTSWLDRLLGRAPDREGEKRRIEHAQDLKALDDLRTASVAVQERTDRLERELLRVNAQLRDGAKNG